MKNNQKGVYISQGEKIRLPERFNNEQRRKRYNTCLSLSLSYLYNKKKVSIILFKNIIQI